MSELTSGDTRITTDARKCGLLDAVTGGWFQQDSNELCEGYEVGRDDVVLDFGCGAGAASLFCAQRGASIMFADVDAAKLDSLQQRLAGSAAVTTQRMQVSPSSPRLELSDATVTRVIAMEVLEHTPDPATVLDELVRVAAPGALFLLTVPDARGEALQKHVAPPAYFSEPNHIHVFDRERFSSLVNGAGLQIQRYFNQGFFWLFWLCCHWLTERAAGRELDSMAQDLIQPPYTPLSQAWTSTWHQMLLTEGGDELKRALDQALPASQCIIARKP